MRYYGMGDRIYIFGFSRGAFTARFLARMISAVGLLSMGNEEMVPFAYKVYQDYEMSKPTPEHATAYMDTFRSAFCRHEGEIGIKVHFLGLFDTVNSVGTFDVGMTGKMKAPGVVGTAYHVRHAVAIDERRVKFKAALLAQDEPSDHCKDEVSKEVWFPGNHGDIGGGWPAETQPKGKLGFWERIKRVWVGSKDSEKPHVDKSGDDFQLSDNALKWMIDELEDIEYPNGDEGLRWNSNKKDFITRIQQESHRSQANNGRMHDTMSFGGGASFWKTLLWRLMGKMPLTTIRTLILLVSNTNLSIAFDREFSIKLQRLTDPLSLDYLPFFRRWELINGKWEPQRFPPNMGGTRDIPPTALFHHSVKERMLQFPDKYHPRNDIDGQGSLHLNDASQNAGRRKLYFEAENKQAERANGDPVQEHDRVYKLVFK